MNNRAFALSLMPLITIVFLSTHSGCDQWNRNPETQRPTPEPDEHRRYVRRWEERGRQPLDHLRMEKWMGLKHYAYRIPVLTRDQELPKVHQFSYSGGTGTAVPRLEFCLTYRHRDSAGYGLAFLVSVGDIIPLFDQIYLVEDLDRSLWN
jgi:hypothetical protein